MVAKEDSILYNLLVHAEWALEGEVLNKSGFELNPWKGSLPSKVLSLTGNSLWWVIQRIQNVFSDGKLLAVLQDQCIEIRSARDDFSSVIAKCPVKKDTHPQWRKLSWSQDCSMLACSNSSGDVYVFDLAGEQLFTIARKAVSLPSDLSQAVAELVFIDHKQSAQWSAELLVINYQGYLKNYLVSPTNGFQENHSFAFCNTLSGGIYGVLYHPQYNMLLIGCSAVTGTRTAVGPSLAFQNGLSAWRILSGYPHYKLIEEEGFPKNYGSSGILKKFNTVLFRRNPSSYQDGLSRFALSQDGTKLVVLHHSGTLSLWEIPSLRNISIWEPDQQPAVEDQEAITAFLSIDARQSNKENAFYGLIDANWWSQEALILGHSKGAVTVASTKESLANLLGHSPEWCEPWPRVTSAHGGGFLILECENKITVSRPRTYRTSDDDGPEDETADEEGQEEEDTTFMSKTKDVAKQVMFFLTESEKFAPPLKRPKILNRTYRLLCICSTTPEELYARKIELEEYGEALGLAETYNLDSDLVYQKQWRKSRVSLASIHDYLCKIKNRLWALNECVERVPDDYDAAKALLEYGLHGTDVHVITAVGEGKVGSSFIVKGDYSEYEDEDNRQEKKNILENSLDFKKFNLEQRDICRYRLKLLQYQDRLSTYELIVGGVHHAHEEYDSNFFTRFRDMNIVQAAVEYAREGNWEAVGVLFTYHGCECLPHRLAILSNFSETKSPREYKELLPEAGVEAEDPEVLECYQSEWRKWDWAERPECKDVLEWYEESDLGEFLYVESPDLEIFRHKLTGDLLTRWYSSRAREIEKWSRQVDNALVLVNLGIERGVKGLEDLHSDLETMEVLVYECCTDIHLGLQTFQDMTSLDKLRMLLGKSTEESFVKDFKRWALPFLERLEKRERGSKMRLIHQYMTDVAKTDLTCILKIFQHSTPERMEPVIPDTVQLIKLALECIYICKRTDQIDVAFSILECLPAPEEDVISEQVGELNKQVDRLEIQLCACEMLEKHGLPKPVSYIVDSEGSKDEAKTLILTLFRLASKRSPPLKEKAWKELLQDILSLQKQVFSCITAELCYEIYAETLLHSGRGDCIALVGQVLCRTSLGGLETQPKVPVTGPRVKYHKSVELVLDAAREYFNSSNNLSDPVMELARSCLNLMEDRPTTIQEELNLIAALALLDDFGVSILPLQVRLCEDKLVLIKTILQSSASAYKKATKLLQLAALLQVCGTEDKTRKGRVLFLVAVAAFDANDYSFAVNLCHTLIEDGYQPTWTICRDIGSCDSFKDFRARREMLSFALTHCTPNEIETLINARSLLETQILYEDINQHLDKQEQGSVYMTPDRVSFQIELDFILRLHGRIENGKPALFQHEAEAQPNGNSSAAPKTILAQVQNRKWWKNTLKWIRPLQTSDVSEESEKQIEALEDTPLRQEFHPFYRSLCDSERYKLEAGFPYEKYRALQRKNKSIYVSQCLLRTQKLSESRAEGAIEEPATEILLQLSESLLKYNMTDTLTYLLALPKVDEAKEFFLQPSESYLCLHLAAYYYSLDLYNMLLPHDAIDNDQADLYHYSPDDVIKHVVGQLTKSGSTNWPDCIQSAATCLFQYHNQMVDFAQAQLLQSLGRGVNIARFAQDPEYKRETILGLAMAIEDEVFSTALSFAERYQVPRWDMFMAHLEWLFTETELATKEIQERINKLDLIPTLLEEPVKMAFTMHENVYPAIEGTKHARLIYYFMLLHDCQKAGAPVQHSLDADTSLKLLKKIKPAAPGLDFKALINAQSPLDVLRPVLTGANVHVLSKLAPKIPSGEREGLFLTPSSVFSVYAVKLFWDGDQKADDQDKEQEVAWNHRYEACHKLLPRMTALHISQFIDTITFTEQAYYTLQLEMRTDIVNRALKFARQQEAARRKKGVEETFGEGEIAFGELIQHLEQSVSHLKSLNDEMYFELVDFDEEHKTSFAKQYDLSRSEPVVLRPILRGLFLYGLSVESIQGIVQLAARQRPQNWSVVDVIQDTVTYILDSIRSKMNISPGRLPMDCLRAAVYSVSNHTQKGGGLVTQEDVLIPMRPFCEDVRVPVSDKAAVLELLEQSFDLRGEDTFLLVYYQTDALVFAKWNRKLSVEEIDNDEKRHQLFQMLLHESSDQSQLVALSTILQIWPVLAATELSADEPMNNPWVQLMCLLISRHNNGKEVLKIAKEIRNTESLNEKATQVVYDQMLLHCSCLEAFKFALVAKYKALHDAVLERMKTMEVTDDTCDKELLELLLIQNLSAQVAQTPFLSTLFNYVLANPDAKALYNTSMEQSGESQPGALVKTVAFQLKNAGLVGEAATLMTRYRAVHPALRTLDTALGALSRWLNR